jgi:hypothetical protein
MRDLVGRESPYLQTAGIHPGHGGPPSLILEGQLALVTTTTVGFEGNDLSHADRIRTGCDGAGHTPE